MVCSLYLRTRSGAVKPNKTIRTSPGQNRVLRVPVQRRAWRSFANDWMSRLVIDPTGTWPNRKARWLVQADWSDCHVRVWTWSGRTVLHAAYTSARGVRPADAWASRLELGGPGCASRRQATLSH